jgi:hypothetical protein
MRCGRARCWAWALLLLVAHCLPARSAPRYPRFPTRYANPFAASPRHERLHAHADSFMSMGVRSERAHDVAPSQSVVRVAIVCSEFAGIVPNGGIGTFYSTLAESLVHEGHLVTLLYTQGTRCESPSSESVMRNPQSQPGAQQLENAEPALAVSEMDESISPPPIRLGIRITSPDVRHPRCTHALLCKSQLWMRSHYEI